MTTLKPLAFLEKVLPSPLLTNETVELRTINRETKKVKRFFLTSLEELLEKAEQYSDNEIYFGVATRYGKSGLKRDCYRVKTYWADFDNKNVEDIRFGKIKPDVIVDSGGGVHAYWILRSAKLLRDFNGESIKQLEAENSGIARKFGADKTTHDASRILRIPNFYNHKYNPERLVRAYAL